MAVPRSVAVSAAVAVALVPLGLAGCGSSSSGSNANKYDTTTAAVSTAQSASASSAATVSLVADPNGSLAFDTTTLTAKAGTVTISMRNPSTSGMQHGIAVQGNGVDKDGPTVQPGGTSTVTVTLKPGTYTYYCPVSGHEAGGMKGTLTVTA